MPFVCDVQRFSEHWENSNVLEVFFIVCCCCCCCCCCCSTTNILETSIKLHLFGESAQQIEFDNAPPNTYLPGHNGADLFLGCLFDLFFVLHFSITMYFCFKITMKFNHIHSCTATSFFDAVRSGDGSKILSGY
jgi:hypothetical protein